VAKQVKHYPLIDTSIRRLVGLDLNYFSSID
jgi:hypothetical protein